MYSDKVLDHYHNPRNVGTLDKTANNVGHGLVGAPACGDVMSLTILVEENENGEEKITDAKFKTFGCSAALSASSLATEWIKDMMMVEAEERIVNDTTHKFQGDIAQELSLPVIKLHCSVLAEDAIKSAISDYKNKKAKRESEQQSKQKEQNV